MLQWSAIPRLVDGSCNGFGKLWEQVRAPKLHTIGTNEETALQISTGSSQVSCPAAPRRHDCEGGPLQKCDVQPGHRTVSVRCREIGLVNNGNAFFLGQERVTRQKSSSKRNKQFKAVALAVPLLKGLLLSKSISLGQGSSMNVAEVVPHQRDTLPW
jgi:hypothetical protein